MCSQQYLNAMRTIHHHYPNASAIGAGFCMYTITSEDIANLGDNGSVVYYYSITNQYYTEPCVV